MALNAGQQVDIVLRRARDPLGAATPRTKVFDFMARIQAIVNGGLERVIQSAPLTVQPQLPMYPIAGFLPSALRIVDIRDASGRSLDGPVPLESLKWLNMEWFREIGPELRSWCVVGKDLLILRPSLPIQQTVTVFYVAVTATQLDDTMNLQISDDDIQEVLDPVEFLLDLKARDLRNAAPILERWQKRMSEAGMENPKAVA